MQKLTETQIQDQIYHWLKTLSGGYFWINYTTGIPCFNSTTGKRFNRRLPAESRKVTDILGIYRGRGCAFEVKDEAEYRFLVKHYQRLRTGPLRTKRDIHIAGQIDFIETLKSKGGISGFVCSVAMTKELLFPEKVLTN